LAKRDQHSDRHFDHADEFWGMLRLEGAFEASEQQTVEHERQDGLRLGGRPS
jgi:hypothetical protein